jgi:hypothetical protein
MTVKSFFGDIENGISDIYHDVKSEFDSATTFIGSEVQGATSTVEGTVKSVSSDLSYLSLAIGGVVLLLGFGLMKSFQQSDVKNIGSGVSDIIRSAK